MPSDDTYQAFMLESRPEAGSPAFDASRRASVSDVGSVGVVSLGTSSPWRTMLRIHRDHDFADDNFDPLYFVEGTEAALEDLFTAAVRAAFVMIARREPVVADIANAIVTIELKTQHLREACAFVTALQ